MTSLTNRISAVEYLYPIFCAQFCRFKLHDMVKRLYLVKSVWKKFLINGIKRLIDDNNIC
jgi:hypothetical protein